MQASFERARDTGLPDQMPLFRYDVHDHESGVLVHRAWSLISAPVLDADLCGSRSPTVAQMQVVV